MNWGGVEKERICKQIHFGVMSHKDIVNSAEFHVYERALYKMPERRPQPNGVLDPRLGISNKRSICETCGLTLSECTGHFGYIWSWHFRPPILLILVYRATAAAPAAKNQRPVTAEEVQQVHGLLERCIERGMSKLEAVQLLARLGVNPKFTQLVWERLEAENPEFFAAYNQQLAATAELERCHL